MKKKWKYLSVIPVFAVLILIRGFINFSAGGYSDEVYTAFSTSPGFNFSDETFFTASYRLFRKTEGFRRFFDGAPSKRIYEAVYLVSMENNKFEKIAELRSFNLSDSDMKYTRGIKDKKGLKLLITETEKDNYYIINCSDKKPDADKIRSEIIREADFIDSSLAISDTKKIFKELLRGPVPEIPSPVKFTDKKKRQLVKDIVRLKGDFYYRASAIDTLSDSEISEILEKMEKYEESLKKGKTEYSIYSEDTKNHIKKRLGL